jgi:DNA-binding NtrC family response regulator
VTQGNRLNASVLVAEDEGDQAAAILAGAGARITRVVDGAAARSALERNDPQVVVSDVRWPRGNGFSILEMTHRLHPRTPIVLFTGQPSVGEAVRAMREGAETYLPKPLGPELVSAVARSIERLAVPPPPEPLCLSGAKPLVGESPAMRALFAQVGLVGPTRTTVLLLGETGTGKERLAQALHDASPRRSSPFVAVTCAALTETVLESELFGHERGAFSGAHARREGRFKIAEGGTLFLDEIGEISAATQVKLLRVLQERTFERVGGNETLSADVRIIAATNRNLREMVEARTFRADLYYRLNVVALEVPPLRERKEDITALVANILPRLALSLGIREPTLTPTALDILRAYDWPGNVRELENVLERSVVLSGGSAIDESMLAHELRPSQRPAPAAGAPPVPGSTFAEIERHAIMATYEACGRSPLKTAAVLGLSARTIHYRLREYSNRGSRRRLRPQERTPCTDLMHPLR